MTKVKFCGLTRDCDIAWANELKPDFIGFIFAQKSRRYLTKERASKLKERLNPAIKVVGVFVNESIDSILSYNHIIDIIQLHGTETNEFITVLKQRTDKPIIKAICINDKCDIALANQFVADYILLDSKEGGSGTVFNWELTKEIRKPFFLAGGLNCDNITDAIKRVSPYAVDVSSGIETNGYKAKDKMSYFINQIRKDKIE